VSYSVASTIGIPTSIAARVRISDLVNTLQAASVNRISTDQREAMGTRVEVVLTQTALVTSSIPNGVTAGDFLSALRRSICAPQQLCIVEATRRVRSLRARAMQAPSAAPGATDFQIQRELNTSSTADLTAPTINVAAIALDLGVAAESVSATTTLVSIDADVTVTSAGSSTTPGVDSLIQAQVQAQSEMPSYLASALGQSVDADDFVVSEVKTRTPPLPPPRSPRSHPPLQPPHLPVDSRPPSRLPPPAPVPVPPSLPLMGEKERNGGDSVPIAAVGAGAAVIVVLASLALCFWCWRRWRSKPSSHHTQARDVALDVHTYSSAVEINVSHAMSQPASPEVKDGVTHL